MVSVLKLHRWWCCNCIKNHHSSPKLISKTRFVSDLPDSAKPRPKSAKRITPQVVTKWVPWVGDPQSFQPRVASPSSVSTIRSPPVTASPPWRIRSMRRRVRRIGVGAVPLQIDHKVIFIVFFWFKCVTWMLWPLHLFLWQQLITLPNC